MNHRTRTLHGLAFLAMLAGPAVVQAQHVYCAGSVAQLQAALADIANVQRFSLQPVDLRIRSGDYAIPAPPAGEPTQLRLQSGLDGGSYRISGGWNAGCTVQSTLPAQATTLDAQGLGGVFRVVGLRSQDNQPQPSIPLIQFDTLRLRNGVVVDPLLSTAGGIDIVQRTWPGLPINTPVPFWRLAVERVRFENCENALDTGASYDLMVRNSVFVDNFGRFPAIRAFNLRQNAWIVNNTFRRNQVIPVSVPAVPDGAEVAITSDPDLTGVKYLTNNIFAESVLGSADTFQLISGGVTFLTRNRIVVSQVAAANSDSALPVMIGNTGVVPVFAGTNDHALSAGSSLRDQGDSAANGGVGSIDHVGSPRVQGAAVDLGAFELSPAVAQPDPLFASSFE